MAEDGADIRPCPRDGAELSLRRHEEVPYWACGRCGGLWFARDDLDRLELRAPKGSRPPTAPATAPARGPENEAARCICPDRPLMALVDRFGVTLDICPACGGVWLDAGEIDRILQCYAVPGPAAGAARVPGPVYPGPGGGAGDAAAAAAGLDLGIEAIGLLFDFLSWG